MEVLSIITKIDTSTIPAGMQVNASGVHAATEKMKVDFQAVAQAEINAAQLSKTAASLRAAAMAGDKAAITEYAAALEATKTAQTELHAAQSAGASGTAALRHEQQEAYHALHLMSHEMGLGLPRSVAHYASSLEGLAPLLAKAFSVVMVIAVVEALEKVPEAIEHGISKLRGWNEEAKKAYEQAVEFGVKLHEIDLQRTMSQKDLATTGLTGLVKLNAEADANIAKAKIQLDEANRQLAVQQKQEALARETKGPGLLGTAVAVGRIGAGDVGGIVEIAKLGLAKEHDIAVKAQEEARKLYEKAIEDKKKLEGTERDKLTAETRAEALKMAEERRVQAIEQAKKIALLQITSEKDINEQKLKLGLITIEEMGKAEETSILKRYGLEIWAAKEIDKINKEKSARGEAPKRSEVPALELKRDEDLAKNRFKYQQDAAKRDDEFAAMRIKAAETITNEEVAGAEARAKALLDMHLISIKDEEGQLSKAEETKYAAQQAALKKEATLADAEGIAGLKKQEDILNRMVEAYQIHRNKMDAIAIESYNKQREQDLKDVEERASHTERMAEMELSAATKEIEYRTKGGMFGGAERAREEIAAVEDWARQTRSQYEAVMEVMRRYNMESTKEYQAMVDKMTELDAKRIEKEKEIWRKSLEDWKNFVGQMSTALFNGINQWIQGHKSFVQALQATWNEMVMNWVKDLEKMAAKWIEEQVLMKAVKAVAGVFGIKVPTASDSTVDLKNSNVALKASIDANTAAIRSQGGGASGGGALSIPGIGGGGEGPNEGSGEGTGGGTGADQIIKGTATAAANLGGSALTVFEQVIQEVPWPFNMIAAPAAAAAVIAMGSSYKGASAAEGGKSTGVGLTLLHPNELVSNPAESRFIRDTMTKVGGSGGRNTHMEPHFHVTGANADEVVAKIQDRIGEMVDHAGRNNWTPKWD